MYFCGSLLVVFLVAFVVKRTMTPRVIGGTSPLLQGILGRMPLLSSCPRAPLGVAGAIQMGIFVVQMMLEEIYCKSAYTFEREDVEVTLPGNALPGGCPERVAVQWLIGRKGAPRRTLPDDAPIVILCAGLNCYAGNLPGTSAYGALLEKPWRVGVFEKRGVQGDGFKGLKSPAFHMFGHPSDLHVAVKRIELRWPKAPIHVVGMSSGNGLAGSYAVLHGREVPNLKSALLLIGGEEYNMAFAPPLGNLLTWLFYDVVLLASSKSRFIRPSEAVLRKHNSKAVDDALSATTLQEFYDICMQHFSGYKDRAEAERRINPFNGGNECMLDVCVPFLVCFTEDDPVAPGGPRQCWLDVVKRCENAAVALYPSGSHLACYDSWRGSRWVEKLPVQWIEAVSSSS